LARSQQVDIDDRDGHRNLDSRQLASPFVNVDEHRR
jgi:hypothetical protein